MRECGIVRDLLPLYQEGMLSPDSVEFLEEHLKTCPACRAEREKLAAEPLPPEEKTETAPELESVRRKLRRQRRRTAALAVCLAASRACFAYWRLIFCFCRYRDTAPPSCISGCSSTVLR